MLTSVYKIVISRTSFREQLGHIVDADGYRRRDTGYLTFSIESTKSPGYLDGRIEAFIDSLQVCFNIYFC